MRYIFITYWIFILLYLNTLAGILSGVVINQNDQPVADVQVEIVDRFIFGITDTSGNFKILDLPDGLYQMAFHHVSYNSLILRDVFVSGNKHVTLDTIRLNYSIFKTDQIIVTATRTEHNMFDLASTVNAISHETIKGRTPGTSAEALREETGIFIQKTNHGGGSAIIRGMSSSQILLMVDGIRLNNSTYRLGNHQYLTTVDFGALRQIEVLHGPGSVQYGSDALGGTINLLTKNPRTSNTEKGIKLGLTTRFASADHERFIRPELTYNTERIAVSGGWSIKQTDDLRRGKHSIDPELKRTANERQKPSAFSGYDMDFKIVFSPSEKSEFIYAWQYTSQNNVPRYDKYENEGYYKWLYEPQDRNLQYLMFTRKSSTSIIQSVTGTISYQIQEEGRIIQPSPENLLTREHDKVQTTGLTLQLNSIRNKHLFSYGSEIYSDRIDSRRRTENPITAASTDDSRGRYPDDAIYTTIGLYIQDEFSISEKWQLVPGVRFGYHTTGFSLPEGTVGNPIITDVDLDYRSVTGSVSILYSLTEHLRLTAVLSQGYRAPNLSDLSKLGESKSLTYEIPNTHLEPEKTDNIELGFKLQTKNITAGFAAFYTRLSDLLASADAMYNGSGMIDIGGTQYKLKSKQNLGKGFITGFEQSLSASCNAFHFYENSAYTYGQNTTDKEPIGGIPPFFGLAGIIYQRNRTSMAFFLRFATSQRRLSADDLDDARIPVGGTPGWQTLNYRFHYKIRDWLLSRVAVENILDRNYREHGSGINGPGRNIILSLEFMR